MQKYDELKESLRNFNLMRDAIERDGAIGFCIGFPERSLPVVVTPYVLNIIISALSAEIAKLDEE